MSLPPIVFLLSCLSLGMAASFTPFLVYGPPTAEVLHPTLREAVAHQPGLEKQPVFKLDQPIDIPEQEHPENDQPTFESEQPIDLPILDEEQPILGNPVHPQEEVQLDSNKPCFVLHKLVLPSSQQPHMGSNKPCSGHPDSAQPCSQQPCSGHLKSAHPCSEQPQDDSQKPCSGHPKLALPCSGQPQHDSQQPCSGHPTSALPCSGQPQHASHQPCSGHPTSALPCSKQLQTVQPLQVSPDHPIVVVRDGVGQYSVGHEIQGPDGQRVSEQGQLITTNGGWEYVIAKKGSYSYTSPEGILVSVDWEADHNGFRIINSSV